MSLERRVEMTSSAFIFDPERGYWLAREINKARRNKPPIGLEFYPTVHGLPIKVGERIRFEPKTDWRVSLDKIKQWRDQYGPVPVERIHLPFHWSIPSALKNYFWNSFAPIAKPYEPGSAKDRAVATAISYMTMTAQNHKAIEMAGELNAELNAHVNIVEAAGKSKKIVWIRGNSRGVLVENDLDYPRIRPEQIEAERDPARAFRAVEKYGLEGVIYGADHAFRHGIDPKEAFYQYREGFDKHLAVIHLSGSRGDHGLITPDDEDFWDFVRFAKENTDERVSLCLDLDPLAMRRLPKYSQLNYFNHTIEELEKAA